MSKLILEYAIPKGRRLSELKAALKTAFNLVEDPVRQLVRCYQDTFDWRLYNNGLILYTETDATASSLFLQSLASPLNVRSVAIDHAPNFADDIPSLILQKKLSPILGVRALIPQLTLHAHSHSLRYVDKEGKTYLHVLIENPKVDLADNKTRLLGKRIRIVPMKGYADYVDKISHYLLTQLHITPAADNLLTAGLALFDRQPGDYHSRFGMKLDKNTRTDDALRNILRNLFVTIEQNEEGVIKDTDSEFLHDFRVATRRTRSALSQIKHALKEEEVKKFHGEFGWLGRITGPTRDMHVYLIKFAAYQQLLPKSVQPYLEPLKQFLERHKALEVGKLVKQLRSERYKKLKQDWQKFLDEPVSVKPVASHSERPAKETADKRIWKMFRRVLKEGCAIGPLSADEDLHELRISCKKLRYLLEFFDGLYPANKIGRLTKTLKQLQDNLGDFQDLHVQIESLKHFEDQMTDEGGMTTECRIAMDLLLEQLTDQQKRLRAEFHDHFALFSEQNNRNLYTELFK